MTIFFLSKRECGPQEINFRKIRLHLSFSANWNKRDNVLKKTSPSSMLKLPKGGFPLLRNFSLRTH